VLKNKPWGIDHYEPKAVVEDSIPPEAHTWDKAKRQFFTEDASKAYGPIPGGGHYHRQLQWAMNPVSPTAKFFKTRRDTVAGEIMHKAKFPEKTSPGCAAYNNGEQKLK